MISGVRRRAASERQIALLSGVRPISASQTALFAAFDSGNVGGSAGKTATGDANALAPDPRGKRGEGNESGGAGGGAGEGCEMNYSEVVLRSAGPDGSSRSSQHAAEAVSKDLWTLA